MTLQNRVFPTGEIVARPFRGEWMGNRGILHDDQRRLGAARWRHKNWICCALEFRGRHRQVMRPRNYTELFFLDDATALAVGHRPCAECRNADYRRFKAVWEECFGPAFATEIDRALHLARVGRDRRQLRHRGQARDLPDGAMFVTDRVWLVWAGQAHEWHEQGYGSPTALPAADVQVLTPAPMVRVLAAGYHPQPHVSLA
ncbi:hypothetical protein [Paracoccus laeviglucosivorans]|uniref:Metal binding domain of Ada n=1 Tax=Paracoccus laeviglucosivorans TaxID=1197861 RepID=A0A521F4R0_9RHOB|nr:hypothetical protein [Paracoccus laeviglucosivorans]SMO91036.1 hypothetical protein SAMN06265221_1184 [Paracoccus laeviglucosivorans]